MKKGSKDELFFQMQVVIGAHQLGSRSYSSVQQDGVMFTGTSNEVFRFE